MPSFPSLSSLRLLHPGSLPSSPGVYIFKDKRDQVIYIGKANNLRQRIQSYFRNPAGLGPKTQKLVINIHTLDYIRVGSELEALLLESRLIKKFMPSYNIASKDGASPYYIHISREEWPRPLISHISSGSISGPYLNRKIPKSILRQLRKISPYCLAPRPVRKPCLYSHLGLCSPCPGYKDPAQRRLYQRNISRLKSLLRGRLTPIRKQLRQEMFSLSKKQKYEQADQIKKYIHELDYLRYRPIAPEEYLTNPNLTQDKNIAFVNSLHQVLRDSGMKLDKVDRIEMFDMAHLGGNSPTAAMTVAINGEIVPRYYRHFKIKSSKSDSDVDMMREITGRRLKRQDWGIPDLIVLDGGKPQLTGIKEIIASQSVPVIALAKKNEVIVIPGSSGFIEIRLPADHPGLLFLMRLRDEAHRFSRRLHHIYRSKDILT